MKKTYKSVKDFIRSLPLNKSNKEKITSSLESSLYSNNISDTMILLRLLSRKSHEEISKEAKIKKEKLYNFENLHTGTLTAAELERYLKACGVDINKAILNEYEHQHNKKEKNEKINNKD